MNGNVGKRGEWGLGLSPDFVLRVKPARVYLFRMLCGGWRIFLGLTFGAPAFSFCVAFSCFVTFSCFVFCCVSSIEGVCFRMTRGYQ